MSGTKDCPAFGVFRIGKRLIGVPIANLAEVCSVPSVSALMIENGPVLGAFNLRGGLVPLIDIEALSTACTQDRPIRQAAVIQEGERLAAIVIDEVVSLFEAQPTKTTAGRAQQLTNEHTNLFPRGFVMDDAIVSCMDARALFSRADILSVARSETSKQAKRHQRNGKHLVLSAGEASIGIASDHIWATVPRQQLNKLDNGVDGGSFLGFIEHIGWRIPVVDTNRVLGIGRVTAAHETEVVVVRFPNDKLIGLHVDATERLASFAEEDLQDSNSLIGASRLLDKVVVTPEKTQVFILNFETLQRQTDLLAVSEFTARLGQTETEPTRSSSDGKTMMVKERRSYLIYKAGKTAAVPAEQVRRILRAPHPVIPASDMPPGVLGFFAVDSRSVPLVALQDDIEDYASGYTLLVAHENERVGFIADRVLGIKFSELRVPAKKSDDDDLIQIREDGEKKLYPLVDLEALAKSILGSADHPARPEIVEAPAELQTADG